MQIVSARIAYASGGAFLAGFFLPPQQDVFAFGLGFAFAFCFIFPWQHDVFAFGAGFDASVFSIGGDTAFEVATEPPHPINNKRLNAVNNEFMTCFIFICPPNQRIVDAKCRMSPTLSIVSLVSACHLRQLLAEYSTNALQMTRLGDYRRRSGNVNLGCESESCWSRQPP